MIWQEKTKIIVMVTDLVEMGKVTKSALTSVISERGSISEPCAMIAELLLLVHMAGWPHCCTICNSQCTNCMLVDVLLISYY